MIYTLTLNPALDHHITVKKLIKDDKITAETVRIDAGGKGINVSRVVRELGGRTKAFTVVGGDRGEIFKRLMRQQQIACAFCEVKENTRTNLKITDRADQSHVQINELGPRLTGGEIKDIIALIENVKLRPSYWVLAGSVPPGVPDGIYRQIITSFQKRGERCVLDADGRAFELGVKARPFMIKPNQFELERLVGRKLKTLAQIVSAGRKLAQTIEVVAITLGRRGSVIVTGREAWRIDAPLVKVRSEVGAGDAFLGGFLAALERGEDVKTASRWAAATAWASVIREGTACSRREDITRLINRINLSDIDI